MIVKLPFGSGNVAVDLRGLRVRPLQSAAPAGQRDLGRLISRALDFPVDGPSLGELAMGRSGAVIVVPDHTRRAELPGVLPVVLNRLLVAGISADDITLLLACGTHPPADESKLADLVGDLPLGVTVRQHDSRAAADLVEVGSLDTGVPVHLDRHAVAADLLIAIGSVRHHYFAGFGGGPKMIFPGIAGHEEIQANHSRVLRRADDGLERHPGCEPGVIEGNPVAEEIARVTDQHPPDFSLCLVPGRAGGVAWAAAGTWRPAFEAAFAKVREWYEIGDGGFDHLVACGGGFPGDVTLIQAHKGLDAICRFANDGAEILFVAELAGGAGSTAMAPFLADPSPGAILDRLAERYVQYGHTTLRIVEKTAKYRVHLLSSMDPEVSRRLGFVPIDDLDSVAQRWRDEGFEDRVAVMSETFVWPRRG